MSQAVSLERGYRRLLGWYPAGHRREHEEEMVGVLLAAARDGRRRPRPGEATNLIWGALRIRLRPAPAGARLTSWRDALAVFSIAAPLLMLVNTITAELLLWISRPGWLHLSLPYMGLTLLLDGQLVLVVPVLLRLRRTAALLALAMAVYYAAVMAYSGVAAFAAVSELVLLLTEAAALAASPGLGRGLELLRGVPGWLLVVAGAAIGSVQVSWLLPGAVVRPLAFAVIATLVAGLAVASPLSRRVLVLLLIPGFPFAVMLAGFGFSTYGTSGTAPGGYLDVLYLVPVLIAGLVVADVLRARRRTIADGAPPGMTETGR